MFSNVYLLLAYKKIEIKERCSRVHMNTLKHKLSRSFSQSKKSVPVEDRLLSRRNYFSHPIKNVEALKQVKEIDTCEKVHDDLNSMYSDNDVYMSRARQSVSENSDEIIYGYSSDTIGSKATYGTTNNDVVISSYTYNGKDTTCCDTVDGKVMFLECGHFVHTKCMGDDLLAKKKLVCLRCGNVLKEDEIKCILIKSMSEYNSEKEHLEKQKQSFTKILAEYQLALTQTLGSLDSINQTYSNLFELYSKI